MHYYHLICGIPSFDNCPLERRGTLKTWISVLRTISVFIALAFAQTEGSFAADRTNSILNVCVSTTDVESLAREVGGERTQVFCFSKGEEDPHQIEIKTGHVEKLSRADLFIQVGLGIENAWLKALVRTAKNKRIEPGQVGHLNLGQNVRLPDGIERAGVPGSFHEEGNPHYLLDPIEGLKAARVIRDKLSDLRPEWKGEFAQRFESFHRRCATALVGEECAEDDIESLALLIEQARSPDDLAKLQAEHKLGGWLGATLPFRGRIIVGDHDLWPYFARRYGLNILGYLEPSPGVPPTTKHLSSVVEQMKAQNVRIILTAPYFDQRHAKFVAEQTRARIVPMAHQTGGRSDTPDYLSMVTYNAEQLLGVLKENK